MRDWMFSSVDVGRAVGEDRRQHVRGTPRPPARSAISSSRMPSSARAGRGIVQAVARGVARRHHHRVHPLRPQRVDRDRGRERGIDAAREAQHDAGEAVLVDIVAQAQDHGAVDRLERPAGAGRSGRARPAARRSSAPRSPAGQRQRLDEAGRLRHQPAVGVEREGAAVEHQLVLAADLVDVEQRQPGLGHPRHGELQPQVLLAVLERRAVGDEQDLGPALGQALGHVLGPHVLADHDAEADALAARQRQGQRARDRAGREARASRRTRRSSAARAWRPGRRCAPPCEQRRRRCRAGRPVAPGRAHDQGRAAVGGVARRAARPRAGRARQTAGFSTRSSGG